MPMQTPEALRRFAVPIGQQAAGTPLVKSTVKLGWMVERRKVRVPLDFDFPLGRRKDFLFRAARQFIAEELKIDGARCYPKTMRIHGPFPHFDPHPPDIQVGDQGGRRPVARSVAKDTTDNGRIDYVLEADFLAPEYVSEVPTDLAMQLFTQRGGRPGLMPLRSKEWRGLAQGASRSSR